MCETSIFTDPSAYAELSRWHIAAETLRRESPLIRLHPQGYRPFWAVTRYADLIELERQPERFPTTWDFILSPEPPRARPQHKPLTAMVGEEHRSHRQVLNGWFRPAKLRLVLEDAVCKLAKATVDGMRELGGRCDFRIDVAAPYPMRVIARAMQLPVVDEELLLRFGNAFGKQEAKLAVDRSGTQAFLHEVELHFLQLVLQRRLCPGDDVISAIATSNVGDRLMDEMTAMSLCFGLASAGHHTTAAALAGGLELLLRNPDQLDLLKREPELIDNAVEEILRRVTPTYHFLRTAQEDYVLAGTMISAGERLLLSFLSANHDELVFEDPIRFDIRRKNANRHLSFGAGAHFCVGAHLARFELREFFRELLPRLEYAELDGEPAYTASTFVGGLKHLPIRFSLRE